VLGVGGGSGHGADGYGTLGACDTDTRVSAGLSYAGTVLGCDGSDARVEVDWPRADAGGGHCGAGGGEALDADAAEDRDLSNAVGVSHQGRRCQGADRGGVGLQAGRVLDAAGG
jgi:hypothetical protein